MTKHIVMKEAFHGKAHSVSVCCALSLSPKKYMQAIRLFTQNFATFSNHFGKYTQAIICHSSPLKLSAAPGGGRSLTVTRLCHLKCFCQLKRPRQLKCVCPSVRTCDRSWSFHTLSVSGKTFLDKFIPLKQLTPATQCCKIYIGRSMLRPFQGTAEDIDRGHGWGSFRQQSQPKACLGML